MKNWTEKNERNGSPMTTLAEDSNQRDIISKLKFVE